MLEGSVRYEECSTKPGVRTINAEQGCALGGRQHVTLTKGAWYEEEAGAGGAT